MVCSKRQSRSIRKIASYELLYLMSLRDVSNFWKFKPVEVDQLLSKPSIGYIIESQEIQVFKTEFG